MYENFKDFTLEDAKKRLYEIVQYQQQIQPLLPNNMLYQYEIFTQINMENVKPNMYLVSNYGRIFNMNTGKQLSTVTRNINKTWYLYVGLQNVDNSRIILAVHNIVALHFLPKTKDDILYGRNIINHINCMKNDPRVCNLEWVTIDENNRYAQLMHEHELFIIPFTIEKQTNWGNKLCGESNGMCSIPDETVHKICYKLSMGASSRECLEYCGLPINNNTMAYVRSIRTRRKRRNISDNYVF